MFLPLNRYSTNVLKRVYNIFSLNKNVATSSRRLLDPEDEPLRPMFGNLSTKIQV